MTKVTFPSSITAMGAKGHKRHKGHKGPVPVVPSVSVVSCVPRLPPSRRRRRLRLGGKRSRRIICILLLTAAAFLASGCTRPGHAAPQSRPLSVDAVRIQRVSTHQELRTYSGTLEAHRTTEVAFELDGIVESVLVDDGAQVDTGSPLAKLDTRLLESSRQELMARRSAAVAQLQEMQAGPLPEEIAASRAEVDDLKARLALVEAKRARRQILVQKNATSNDEYEEFIHGVESAQAQFQSAQKRLKSCCGERAASESRCSRPSCSNSNRRSARSNFDSDKQT